jgi:hypothetical protein
MRMVLSSEAEYIRLPSATMLCTMPCSQTPSTAVRAHAAALARPPLSYLVTLQCVAGFERVDIPDFDGMIRRSANEDATHFHHQYAPNGSCGGSVRWRQCSVLAVSGGGKVKWRQCRQRQATKRNLYDHQDWRTAR